MQGGSATTHVDPLVPATTSIRLSGMYGTDFLALTAILGQTGPPEQYHDR